MSVTNEPCYAHKHSNIFNFYVFTLNGKSTSLESVVKSSKMIHGVF